MDLILNQQLWILMVFILSYARLTMTIMMTWKIQAGVHETACILLPQPASVIGSHQGEKF